LLAVSTALATVIGPAAAIVAMPAPVIDAPPPDAPIATDAPLTSVPTTLWVSDAMRSQPGRTCEPRRWDTQRVSSVLP
jgi:hypothetical protein